jgi:membrane fusion protein, copper/silver efflux system
MSHDAPKTGTTMPRRVVPMGIGAGALLLAGVVLGLLLGQPSGQGAEHDAPRATQDMQEMDDMQEMEDMAMAAEDGRIRIARAVAGRLGITSEAAEEAPLRRAIRTTGLVVYDETRLSTVSPRFGGWVERLHVDFTGRSVRAGEPLVDIYSPELISAQEELLSARRLKDGLAGSLAPGAEARTDDLVDAARRRLLLWEISPEQIDALEATGEVRRTLTMHAPQSGFVVEKTVDAGAAIQPGAVLYRLADLSRVWLELDVYEADLRFARPGEPVEVRVDAYPGETFSGRITYVYPDVKRDTRTGRVRVELANPEGRIKPGMFVVAHMDVEVTERAVLVPRDAVMYTGERRLVFVELSPGLYESREVEVGATVADRAEIVSGLRAGERVVARANFIVDAESRLMETMMGQPAMPGMEMDMDMEEDEGGDDAEPRD